MQGHSRWLPRVQQQQIQGFVELRMCGLVKSAQAIQNPIFGVAVQRLIWWRELKNPEISLYSNCNFYVSDAETSTALTTLFWWLQL